MRHIPEEEFHAYLDQALSRSQCVEIERHLTRCTRCRMAREAVAAARDRTTDLLASLGPPPFLIPQFQQIRQKAQLRGQLRRRRMAQLAAAAVAAGTFITVATWGPARPPLAVPAPTQERPSAVSIEAGPIAAPAVVVRQVRPTARPARHEAAAPIEVAARPQEMITSAPPVEAPSPDRSTAAGTLTAVTYEEPGEFVVPTAPDLGPVSEVEARPVDPFPTPPGLWRTVASDNGEVAVPAGAARIPGLTVVRVRIQPGPGAEVVAVDQLLESGETVRTLSGPPERVHRALAGDGEFRDSGEDGKLTVTVRQEDRMVAVTGPAGVLGTLLSTSDLRRRY